MEPVYPAHPLGSDVGMGAASSHPAHPLGSDVGMGAASSHPAHPLTPEALKYLESMSPSQKKLHDLAIKMLASSYFVERTRGFEDWKKKEVK